MALADYRLCDVCERKAFYDAQLNYEFAWEHKDDPEFQPIEGASCALDYVGAWAVICRDCAKTHEVKVVLRTTAPAGEEPGHG